MERTLSSSEEGSPRGVGDTGSPDPHPETRSERRAGPELLPDLTSDDADLVEGRDDDWYLTERPPHHG